MHVEDIEINAMRKYIYCNLCEAQNEMLTRACSGALV